MKKFQNLTLQDFRIEKITQNGDKIIFVQERKHRWKKFLKITQCHVLAAGNIKQPMHSQIRAWLFLQMQISRFDLILYANVHETLQETKERLISEGQVIPVPFEMENHQYALLDVLNDPLSVQLMEWIPDTIEGTPVDVGREFILTTPDKQIPVKVNTIIPVHMMEG